jgi:DNA-binding transcriptional ArsR family regulator
MLKKNSELKRKDSSEKIVEQLLEETGQKFQRFTRTVTVENDGEMAQFTISELLKELSEYLVTSSDDRCDNSEIYRLSKRPE